MFGVVELLTHAVAAQGADAGGGGLFSVLFIPVMLLAVWFLMIRPQQKQQSEHQTFLSGLQKGSEVVTYGGILGKVHLVEADTVTVEIAKDVRVKVQKNMVYAQKPPAPAAQKTDAKADGNQAAADKK